VAKTAFLNPAIALCEELMMQEGDRFIITDILDAKLGSEVLLEETQRQLLQPEKEVQGREQYSSC
jgi:hypothetical protein